MTHGTEIDVLGPLRLRVDGLEVDVPGARRRALLAVLALAQARVVGVGALIEAVWGMDPPASAGPTLHSHLSRLRGHLGARAGDLVRVGGGYRLVLDTGDLDVARAEAFAVRARALRPTDPAAAADQLRLALGLWRGDALAEFGEIGPLGAEAVRLARLRQQLTDELLDARIAGEPAAAVVGDVARAAVADPLRESTQLLLVRALALDGRAAEALAAARDFRRRLADETGLATSAALADLERAVARGEVTPPTPPSGTRTPVPRVRVPRSPTPLLGRADELDRLAELLRADRCVTIVGPGGVGKTRLMLDVVRRAAPRWPDGATLVELAPVRDAATVPFVLAQALAVSTRGDLLPAVIDFLSTRRQILVIDNCEHLLTAVRELVAELLRWVPNLAVLTTSRAPLGAAGEWVFRLGPLALAAPGRDPCDAAAVRLFLDRARQARGGTELDGAAVGDAVEICRGLDGLPLAIELAASRLTVLSASDLRARMAAGLDLGRGRAAPPDDHRHQTLRDTIAWSYRLLDVRAQRLFRHLAAVPGVFDLSVAEFVAGAIAGDDPVAALGALVDTSMVETVAAPVDPGGPTAFRMLDSIRAFGTEAARTAGELGAAQDLVADWTCSFSQAAAEGLQGPDGPLWGRRILAALPVLRAGRERLLERGERSDVAAAVRICVDLEEYAIWHDNAELWAWTLDSARLRGAAELPDAARLFAVASHAAWRSGSLAQAVDLARRALDCATDKLQVSVARYALGTVALFTGDYDAAVEDLVACADVATYRTANQLAVAALAASYGGRDTLAEELVTRADRLTGATSMAVTRAFVPYVQAEIHTHTDPAAARRHAERALAEARASGITFIVGITLVTLASSAARTGDLATAAACYPEVIGQWLRTGSWPQQWTTLRNTADLFAQLGREEDALLVLTAADADPDAPAVVGVDAEQLAGLVTSLHDRLGAAAVARIHQDATRLTRVEVVERALAALAAVRVVG